MSVFWKKATVKTFFFELTNISKLWWHVISKTQEFDKFTEKWINYLQKSANYTDICFLIRYLISDIGYLQKICKIYIILICKRYPLYDYLLLFYRYRYTTPIYLLSVICKKTISFASYIPLLPPSDTVFLLKIVKSSRGGK